MVSCASDGICGGYDHAGRWIAGRADGADVPTQYHAGYACVNRYIAQGRAASDRELSTEYIIDGGGNIVAINDAIAQIVRGGDRWIPTDGGMIAAGTAACIDSAIADAMRTAKPIQRDIVELLARGYSQAQIAAKKKRARPTIAQHVALVRKHVADYIKANYPDIAYMVDMDGVNSADMLKPTNARRTEEGRVREKANCKARHSAEYYRAYRARKAAARAAAQNNK